MRARELAASHSQPRTGGSAANNHGPQSCHLPHSQRRSFQSKRSAALQRPHPTAPGTHTVAGREKGQRRRPTREPVPTELGVRTPYAAASRLGAVPSRAWACWDAETRNKGRRPPTGQGAFLRRASRWLVLHVAIAVGPDAEWKLRVARASRSDPGAGSWGPQRVRCLRSRFRHQGWRRVRVWVRIRTHCHRSGDSGRSASSLVWWTSDVRPRPSKQAVGGKQHESRSGLRPRPCP